MSLNFGESAGWWPGFGRSEEAKARKPEGGRARVPKEGLPSEDRHQGANQGTARPEGPGAKH